jgi:hypothetical protein
MDLLQFLPSQVVLLKHVAGVVWLQLALCTACLDGFTASHTAGFDQAWVSVPLLPHARCEARAFCICQLTVLLLLSLSVCFRSRVASQV